MSDLSVTRPFFGAHLTNSALCHYIVTWLHRTLTDAELAYYRQCLEEQRT
jgi:hypothetical protein